MITIEPPSTIPNLALSLFYLKRIRNLARSHASHLNPGIRASSTATKPGAPHLDFEMWASSGGRPPFLCRKRALLACLILLTTLPVAIHAQSPDWQLVWSDEFNAPNGSAPDPAKWNIVIGGEGFGNNELETYTNRPANVHQQNGNLVITAQKEDLTGPDGIPHHYTSARLNTQNHIAQKYGRFEARIQLPTGKGIWPAFWLLGDNHETAPWPDCGEIDILETIGAPDTIYSTLHGPGYSGRKGPTTKFPLPAGESVNTAFHVYAVEWSPDDIKFFFDDRLIAHRTPADLPPGTHWVYDHPFYILLNLAVGGYWPGIPDDTTIFPQQMLIDYVRVYSRKPATPQATTKSGAPSIDSDVWASSEGRPSLKSATPTAITSRPTR
ncbi:MAG TPA: glycoside hydrolase family 16 protein [Edaphobacter sp.]|nr:glycoside hydrolase family 16 protein [Edaphobacter sp.]